MARARRMKITMNRAALDKFAEGSRERATPRKLELRGRLTNCLIL
jgi:hypothetical protein